VVGRKFGNYRLMARLAEGGMGVVYLAQHSQIGRRAAIKVLHPRFAGSQESLRRFFNEARAASAVNHAGIVKVFDYGVRKDGSPFIVMELLEGENLSARIKRKGKLALAETVEFAQQAASALAAAHRAGVVHRDLKPENLFVIADEQSRTGVRVKVLDFGIAKLEVHGEAALITTGTGQMLGTPLYMSPEQMRGAKDVGTRADIYALGLIVYAMLCGRPPFVAEGFGTIAMMHISELPRPPRELNPAVPPELERVVLKALEKEPSDRYATMDELRAALGETGIALTEPIDLPIPEEPSTPTPSVLAAQNEMSTLSATAVERPARSAGSRWRVPATTGGGFRWWVPVVTAVGGGLLTVLFFVFLPKPGGAGRLDAHTRTSFAVQPEVLGRTPERPMKGTVRIEIRSNPPGANVRRAEDGAPLGVTPVTRLEPRGRTSLSMQIDKPGYEPKTVSTDLRGNGVIEVTLTPTDDASDEPTPRR
jgi:serine/threonine-protein kinase